MPAPKDPKKYREWIEKMSKARKGRKFSIEHRLKLSDALKGKQKSEETKRKISNANKGKPSYLKGKTYEEFFGEKLAKKIKKKISDNHADMSGKKSVWYGRKHTEETKDKIRKHHLGKSYEEKFGIEKAQQIKKKLSKIQKSIARKGSDNPWYGHKHSKETILKFSINRKGSGNVMYGRNHSEETKRKISKINKGRQCSFKGLKYEDFMDPIKAKNLKEKCRLRMLGNKGSVGEKNGMYGRVREKSPTWKGGLSFEPYTPEFNKQFKNMIRNKFHNQCFICNSNAKGVHHINYIKEITTEQNVVLLCKPCHAKTNHNRDYWFAFFCYHLGIEPEDMVS